MTAPRGPSWHGDHKGAQATHAKRRALILRRHAAICRARLRAEGIDTDEPDPVDARLAPDRERGDQWADTPDKAEHETANLRDLQSDPGY